MDKHKVKEFFQSLDCQNIQISSGSDWVRASCPLAPWFHNDKDDKKPSFAVRAVGKQYKNPIYHCHTCGNSGLLPRLMHNIQWCSNQYYKEASNILSNFEFLGDEAEPIRGRRRITVTQGRYKSIISSHARKDLHVSPEILDKYPLLAETNSPASREIQEWLVKSQRVPVQSIALYKLRIYIDPFSGALGIIFPIYDRSGEMVMDLWVEMIKDGRFFRLSARMTNSKVDYHAINLWFGNQFFKEDRPLVLVSGPLDVLRLRSFGMPNVWAYMARRPSPEQLHSIRAKVVYVAFDDDGSGRVASKSALLTIQARSRILLNWRDVGVKGPRDLKDVRQFRRVYDERTKIESSSKTAKKRHPSDRKNPHFYWSLDSFDI